MERVTLSASNSADVFVETDREFLSGKKFNVIDTHCYADGEFHAFITERFFIADAQENICGVAGFLTEIQIEKISKFFFNPLKTDQRRFASKQSELSKSFKCYNNPELLGQNLTQIQATILFYIIRGYSANEIGLRLHRSKRTIESHLVALKQKLRCASQRELIELAIDAGFLYQCPAGLLYSLDSLSTVIEE